MFDLLHLVLTFFVGFAIAYYLFVWRNSSTTATPPAAPPPSSAPSPATSAPGSPLPTLHRVTSTPRIDISPPKIEEQQQHGEGETAAPSSAPDGQQPVAVAPPSSATPGTGQPQQNGGSRRVAKKAVASPGGTASTPSSPLTPSKLSISAKKAQSEDSVTPSASPLFQAGVKSTSSDDATVAQAQQVAQIGQQRQSRSLNAIPKASDTKDAIKKLSAKARDSTTSPVKRSAGSAIGRPAAATPINLADWRRTGASASHSALMGGPESLCEEGAPAIEKRKIVSSELPKQDKKGGSQRGLASVTRRLRSSSSNAKKNAASRVYPYQFDELSPDLAELKKAFAHPVTGVRTKTLTRKLTRKTYHHCFVGYDAVDWMLETVGGLDRRQAVNLGVRMWASGFFKHVGSKRPFSDGPNHFYFAVDDKNRKKRLSLKGSKGSKRRRNRRESVADLVMGEEKPIQDALKPREGWLDVKQGDTWTKHWCLVTEMRQIKEKLESHAGQTAAGSDDEVDEKWAGWGLAIFEELVDKSLLDFVEELTAAGTGVKIKARRHYLRNYGRCFAGSRAVDWCLTNAKSASRQEAILSMTTLLQKGLITHVDKEPMFKDSKHDYYKFNIPVGPGGGKDAEKEKKKEEKKEKKEKKKEEKERRKEREEMGGDYYSSDGGGGGYGDISAGAGGKVATCPIAILPLSDCLIKLEKSGNHVEIVLYRNDGNRIFLPGWKSPALGSGDSDSGSLSSSGRENRRSWRKGSAFDESASYFSIRIHRKDDTYVREWIFALEAAMLLGEIEKDGFTLDATVVSDEDDEEEDDEEEEEAEGAEAGEIEMIEEEGSDEVEEAGDQEEGEEAEKSDEGESMTEEESTEKQEELMDSTEKIVLQEMRREIEQQMAARKQQPTASQGKLTEADEVDYTTVSDGELLKFLRARRLVVADAMVLMKSSVPYRRRNNLYNIKISDVMQEVGGCMLQLVEGARDREGRVVLLVQPQNYTPAASPPLNVVRAVMYLLDKAQEDVEVQRKGFTVLVDGTGSKYSNFDPKMPRVLLDGIISRYPARIGYTIITNMPWFFRFVWAVIRPLLSEKLAQRFHIVTADKLVEFIPPDRLLPIYGGNLHYDHRAWIRKQHENEGLPYSG